MNKTKYINEKLRHPLNLASHKILCIQALLLNKLMTVYTALSGFVTYMAIFTVSIHRNVSDCSNLPA